jgi:parvulin-like peptidyl-prolyl isomerase
LIKKLSVIFAAVMLFAIITVITACNSNPESEENNRIVLKIDGNKVTYDEYRYFFLNSKADLQSESESQSESLSEVSAEQIKSAVLEMLRRNYAIDKLAEEYDVLSDKKDEIQTDIENAVASIKDQNSGEDDYTTLLSDEFLTDRIFRKMVGLNQTEIYLRRLLLDESTTDIKADDETVEADFNKNFARAAHIMIMFNNGKTDEENRALAEELRDRAASGEDFDALIKEYTDDVGYDYNNGYYITYGEYDKNFEDAIYSLDIDQISDVVKTIGGYHIIKRLPLNINYLYVHFDDIRAIYMTRTINELIQKTADSLEIEFEELYAELDLTTVT